MYKCYIFALLFAAMLRGKDHFGKTLYLDGQCDFVQLFAPVIYDVPFTIEAWAYLYGPGGGVYAQNPIFEQRSLETVMYASAILLNAQNGEGFTAWTIRDYEHYLNRAKTPQLPHFEWHHYAGVVTRDDLTLYIDGQPVDSTINEQSGPFHLDYDHVAIGRHAYLEIVAGYFNGFIDDLRIWNYARSGQEIREGMTSPLTIEDERIRTGLVAYWDFDRYFEFWKNDVHWLGVEDMSGNGHHGALVGNAELVYHEADLVLLQNFSLTSPADGQIVYATCPVLTWESATAAEIHSPQSIEYEIFIDTSAGFDNPTVLLTRGKTTTVQVCDLAPDRIYYWKVKAENIVGASQWSSQVYSFVLAPEDQQHVTLKDFSLITPGFNAIVNTTHPTVYWESAARDIIKSPDDIVYRVLYSSSPNFEMSQSITIDGDVSWVELPRLQPGTICFWKVIARNKAGMEKTSLNYSALAIGDHTTGGEKEQHDLDNFVLFQNYPNPFNPWTTIRFNLAEDSEAVVTVYDIAGYAVRKLLREYKGAGEHAVVWDGIDDQGNKLCSGVYIYRLQFLDSQGNIRVSDKKMMLLK